MCVDGRDIYVPLWCIPRTRCVFINHGIFDIYQFKVTQATTIPPPNLPSVLLLLLLLSPPPPPLLFIIYLLNVFILRINVYFPVDTTMRGRGSLPVQLDQFVATTSSEW